MNNIDALIEKHCPYGIDVKRISDIVISKFWIMPATPKYINEEGVPYITSKNIRKGEINFDNVKNISKDDYLYVSKNREIQRDDILVSMIGTLGEVARVKDSDLPFYGQNMYLLRVNKKIIDVRYFYYFFDTIKIKTYLNSIKNNSGQGYLKQQHVDDIKIPIPPLPIQQEIVNILDKFTQLDAELNAELEARRKQYKFYSNEFFRFDGDEVERKTLGEIGNFIRGKRFVKDDITTEGVPCIHYGELYTHYKISTSETKSFLEPTLAEKLRAANPGDVIIVAAGETVEDIGNSVAWMGNSKVVIHDACFAYSHKLNPKYVSYYFHTDLFRSQIKKHISSGKISAINASGLSKAIIPIPPLAKQERIVGILDKFDKLVNDMSVGLPAEIEARRKQYEYYRGKLLDFKNVNHG
jgi:type I restriction enzyme, S subunit